jgi:hypothetical protein
MCSVQSREIIFVSAHADAFSSARRRVYTGEVVDWARNRSTGSIVIIGGDFNFELNPADDTHLYTDNLKNDSEAYSYALKYFRDLGRDADRRQPVNGASIISSGRLKKFCFAARRSCVTRRRTDGPLAATRRGCPLSCIRGSQASGAVLTPLAMVRTPLGDGTHASGVLLRIDQNC